jgi:predicted lysophospholipase L1 biosynthesis ABC-type transport system permease subunit
LFFSPDMWVPMVDQEQVQGMKVLDDRAQRNIYMVLGHMKAGVTPAQAIADLNSVGAYLERTYPKVDAYMTFSLARPSLAGDMLGPGVKGFMTGMMLLAGLILLAACANLGSLFAARAADRSREVALRLALGSTRTRILRALLTEAVLIALAGGTVGLAGSVALLRALTAWRPFSSWPMHLAVNPDARVYLAALLLAIVSGLFFGAVPVRQVLHTNPYEVIKAGPGSRSGKRVNAREVLLVAQIAICAVLVTSSLVAVRGLARSLHTHFGFDLDNIMLAEPDLGMAGYSGDRVPAIQKRMIEALRTIPGVEAVGLSDAVPFGMSLGVSMVFRDNTTDLRPTNANATAYLMHVAPGYFRAAGTTLLSGRDFSWQDDKNAPRDRGEC